ncbi:MAG: hypothetical protein M1549_00835 [Candidatus Dependentiae bacterium]|nr:hypothetical protein [Candidatus Dependentiae bacterium]
MKKVALCLVMLTLVPQTWAMEKMEKNEEKEKTEEMTPQLESKLVENEKREKENDIVGSTEDSVTLKKEIEKYVKDITDDALGRDEVQYFLSTIEKVREWQKLEDDQLLEKADRRAKKLYDFVRQLVEAGVPLPERLKELTHKGTQYSAVVGTMADRKLELLNKHTQKWFGKTPTTPAELELLLAEKIVEESINAAGAIARKTFAALCLSHQKQGASNSLILQEQTKRAVDYGLALGSLSSMNVAIQRHTKECYGKSVENIKEVQGLLNQKLQQCYELGRKQLLEDQLLQLNKKN